MCDDSFEIIFEKKFGQKLTIIITKVKGQLFDIQVNLNKVVIKILPGSVVTQPLLGGLTVSSIF